MQKGRSTITHQTVLLTLIVLLSSPIASFGQVSIAQMKYAGGGDWYANATALPNLIRFCNSKLNTNLDQNPETVEAGSVNIFSYPYIYLTGHGNVSFSQADAENLRRYLLAGGFIHIDDNYGLDPFIRVEMKKVFPELDFVELPWDHPIYHQKFKFPQGLPKIHEHDGQAPQGFGLIYQGRLVCFYSYESDLGNGWEDASIHGNPEELRLEALRMGANILSYVFSQP